jgi:Ca2+-binding RTX toxin-like protein
MKRFLFALVGALLIGAGSVVVGHAETINGTSGDDTLECPTNANWTVKGKAGDDDIICLDGNDTLDGSTGNDNISAGRGKNIIKPGDGDDYVTFDSSYGKKNTVSGSKGEDTIIDECWYNCGDNRLRGGEHNDFIYSGDGDDDITGDPGDDDLYGGDGDDCINGNGNDAGGDYCNGGYGTDCCLNCEYTDYCEGTDPWDWECEALDCVGSSSQNPG